MGVMDQLSANVLKGSESGLMGLAWPALAQTGADAWWLTVATSNTWTAPMFGFYLARFVNADDPQTLESAGGSMSLGFADSNYYTGNINYVSLTDKSYWLVPLGGITIGGKKLSPGGQAAIDTYVGLVLFAAFLDETDGGCGVFILGSGTSLIGAPSSVLASIYANVPGAEMGTGDLEGYYTYRASSFPPPLHPFSPPPFLPFLP